MEKKTYVMQVEAKETKKEESWVTASDGRRMPYSEWLEEQKANRDW